MQHDVRQPVLVALALWLPTMAAGQPEAPVDRTDPAAVAAAYLAAVEEGDVEQAIALLADDEKRNDYAKTLRAMTGDLADEGFTFWDFFQELLLLPVGSQMRSEPGEPQAAGETVTVPARRTLELDAKVVVKRQDDGTYGVDLLQTILQSTGRESSVFVQQMAAAVGGGPGPGPTRWQCDGNLTTLARALNDYAQEHGGTLPLADTWCDDILPYVLDREVFQCPGAPGFECGYAYNLDVAGQPLPDDWQARGDMVLLFDSDLRVWNAADTIEDTPVEPGPHGDGRNVVCADAGTVWVPAGWTFSEVMAANQEADLCQQRLGALCKAALDYAEDNDYLLPEGDTWCDDIAPYLPAAGAGEDAFQCPARPDLLCGYAMNEELTGKDISQMTGHRRMVLLFETDEEGYNVAAAVTAATKEERHYTRWEEGGGYYAAFLNGDVNFLRAGQPPARQGW